MVKTFIASPPAGQHAETVRQFQQLQTVLEELERRLNPQAFSVTGSNITLTTGWQALTFSGVPEIEPGTYAVTVTAFAIGSAGNAEVQFRSDDGTTVVTGGIMVIGNNTVSVTSTLVVPQGASIVLEARGISTQLTSLRLTAHRVGAAQ